MNTFVTVIKGFTISGEQYRKGTQLKFRKYLGGNENSEVLGRLYKKDGTFTLFHIDQEFFNTHLEYIEQKV